MAQYNRARKSLELRNFVEPPDRLEKGIRFGCGFLLGCVVAVGALLSSLWSGREIVAWVLLPGLVSGYATMRLGDRFWDAIRGLGVVDLNSRLMHVTAPRVSVAMNRSRTGIRMCRSSTKLLACMVVCALSGCGLFDSGVEWRDGPFKLLWIDVAEQTSLNYEWGKHGAIGLVDWTVFAVGSNDRYIVVKQHPRGNKAVTNYFIVDKREALPTDLDRAVVGPLTQAEFTVQARSLPLPQFTKVLSSLQ